MAVRCLLRSRAAPPPQSAICDEKEKAAVAAYRERKSAYGVFAVICAATGEAWVGQSRHLDTQQNALWFALRLVSSPHASLPAVWTVHSPDDFRFEELERLRDDVSPIGRSDALERRQALWAARLGAHRL